MDDGLQGMLRDDLQAGTASNEALAVLVDDYARYHMLMVMGNSQAALAPVAMTLFFG